MADDRNDNDRSAGFDVWLPAAAAILAAAFMIASAHAEGAPRSIYDPALFDGPVAESVREGTALPAMPAPVAMIALPALETATVAADPEAVARPEPARSVVAAEGSRPATTGWVRLGLPLLIAMLLLGVLGAIGHTWRRTEPLLA